MNKHRVTAGPSLAGLLRTLLVALALALGLTAAPAAAAQASSPDEAAAMVQARSGGQILGVQAKQGQYLVKVLTGDGRVRVVAVPMRR
ncbi:MAG: hypothetical protein GKR94_10110 [Gammaproteobacteria bacterium]|nr:hypothetical protein [Gammaproteobacteria bacterium]